MGRQDYVDCELNYRLYHQNGYEAQQMNQWVAEKGALWLATTGCISSVS
jgi:hypothetical protein